MSSGGHISEMISRYKNNMAWITKKRYFNKSEQKYENFEGNQKGIKEKASEEQIRRIRLRSQNQKRKENIRLLGILAVSLLLGALIIYAVLSHSWQ